MLNVGAALVQTGAKPKYELLLRGGPYMAQGDPATDSPATVTSGGNGASETGAKPSKPTSDEKALARKRAQQRRAREKRTQEERRQLEEQLRRELWEDTDNVLFLTKVSSRAYTIIIAAFAAVFVAGAIVFGALGDTMGIQDRERVIWATALAGAGFLFFAIAAAVPSIRRARRLLREREEEARKKAREASDELSDALDLTGLLKANRKQMEAYDELARVQSRESFRNSQIAMAIGLAVLVFGALAVILVNDTASKITTATLTGLGGLLSGYISRTFLRVYERSQQQLTFFFQQPLVNSYILAADRMIERMASDEIKDNELSHVVDHVLSVLIQLPQSWDTWTDGGSGRRQPAVVGSTVNGTDGQQPSAP